MKYELEMNMAVMAEVSTNQSKYFILRQKYGVWFEVLQYLGRDKNHGQLINIWRQVGGASTVVLGYVHTFAYLTPFQVTQLNLQVCKKSKRCCEASPEEAIETQRNDPMSSVCRATGPPPGQDP